MNIPPTSVLETMSDRTWGRVRDILYAPISEEAKTAFLDRLAGDGPRETQVDIVMDGAEAEPVDIAQAITGQMNDWMTSKEVQAALGLTYAMVFYNADKYDWAVKKDGRAKFFYRPDVMRERVKSGKTVSAILADAASDPVADIPLPFATPPHEEMVRKPPRDIVGDHLCGSGWKDSEEDEIPAETTAPADVEAIKKEFPDREETLPLPPEKTDSLPIGKVALVSKDDLPRKVPDALRDPKRALHAKEPIAMGVSPRNGDPVIGEDGVHMVEGDIYVTGPVAASCLNMATSRFQKTVPGCGTPGEVKRHWQNGALELFCLADLKKSIFYRVNGRMGF